MTAVKQIHEAYHMPFILTFIQLAFQVELLKSNPATFNVGREKQKSLPAEYAAGKQIYRVDPLQKVINIDTSERFESWYQLFTFIDIIFKLVENTQVPG